MSEKWRCTWANVPKCPTQRDLFDLPHHQHSIELCLECTGWCRLDICRCVNDCVSTCAFGFWMEVKFSWLLIPHGYIRCVVLLKQEHAAIAGGVWHSTTHSSRRYIMIRKYFPLVIWCDVYGKSGYRGMNGRYSETRQTNLALNWELFIEGVPNISERGTCVEHEILWMEKTDSMHSIDRTSCYKRDPQVYNATEHVLLAMLSVLLKRSLLMHIFGWAFSSQCNVARKRAAWIMSEFVLK